MLAKPDLRDCKLLWLSLPSLLRCCSSWSCSALVVHHFDIVLAALVLAFVFFPFVADAVADAVVSIVVLLAVVFVDIDGKISFCPRQLLHIFLFHNREGQDP